MKELIASATLLATILVCLAFGVLLGYTVIVGILRLFGNRPRTARPTPRPTLIPIAGSTGD